MSLQFKDFLQERFGKQHVITWNSKCFAYAMYKHWCQRVDNDGHYAVSLKSWA